MTFDKTRKASGDANINDLRGRIDAIDDQLLDLANQRLVLARRIGAFKRQTGAPVADRHRESNIMDRLLAENSGPLGTYDLHRIFGDLMAAARRVQSRDAICAAAPVYAVFGDPVAHSLSPVMHTSAFLHAGLDELDDMAARIGAVNTIVNRGGRLCGYNSDWQGAVAALAEKTAVSDRQVVVIGAGGAARAVAFGIKKKGGRLTILNRSRKNGEILAAELDANFVPLEEVKKLACDIVINTTPVGMAPHEDTIPLDSRILQKEMVVMDVVYSPLKTRLLAAAEAVGCTIVDGLAMFVYQGAMQFELWTQTDAPVNTMRRAVQEALLPKTELI